MLCNILHLWGMPKIPQTPANLPSACGVTNSDTPNPAEVCPASVCLQSCRSNGNKKKKPRPLPRLPHIRLNGLKQTESRKGVQGVADRKRKNDECDPAKIFILFRKN